MKNNQSIVIRKEEFNQQTKKMSREIREIKWFNPEI